MKKLFVIMSAFCITGCMTQQKAVKVLQKHHKLAGVCADNYPVVDDSIGTPVIVYKPANNTDYTAALDSLKSAFDDQLEAFKDAERQQAHDTGCANTIRGLQNKYENLMDQYLELNAKYRACKPDTQFITRDIYHDTNPAKKAALQGEITALQSKLTVQTERAQSAQNKAAMRGKLMWGTWIVLTLIIVLYVFLKSRTAFVSSIISKVANGKI